MKVVGTVIAFGLVLGLLTFFREFLLTRVKKALGIKEKKKLHWIDGYDSQKQIEEIGIE